MDILYSASIILQVYNVAYYRVPTYEEIIVVTPRLLTMVLAAITKFGNTTILLCVTSLLVEMLTLTSRKFPR